MKIILITLLVLAVAMVTASISGASRYDVLTTTQTGEELREEFKQTYPLSATGRVSLENINGSVRISVWDRNEVLVSAVKKAYRRERLDEATIQVRATEDTIRIRTEYPSRSQTFTSDERGRINNPATVDYTLTVPRQARLEAIELINGELQIDGAEGDVRASSINGPVKARGLKGEARLSTINGPLEATFIQLNEAKPLTLNSVNGSVLLVIPSNANGVVRASTVHGAIKNDFGLSVRRGQYVGNDLHGQLGTGGPRIRLSNVNGSITIKHAADGAKLSPVSDLTSDIEADKQTKLLAEQSRQIREVSKQVRQAEIEAARVARQERTAARQEIDRAVREAQREIQQAQREMERAQVLAQRELRQRLRAVREVEKLEDRNVVARETDSFKVGSKPRVNLGTHSGTIKVKGWDKSEVAYMAEKSGHSAEELKQIQIETKQDSSQVSIISRARQHDGTVSLEVNVPRNAIIHATSADGSLSIEGVSGEITLRTGDGPIQVVGGGGRVIANTGDGEISISNFEGQVEARTGDGSIALDGKFTSIAARTGDGSISLAVPAESNFTIETNVEALKNEGLTLTEDVAPSKRVKRWRIGTGGNVFTIHTGHGDLILRPRQP